MKRLFALIFSGLLVACGSSAGLQVERSTGRSTETTYEMVNENGQIQRGGEKVEYSDDGLTAVKTTYYTLDSLPTIIASRSVSTYDKKGRLIKREGFDPDETDEIHPRFSVDTYKYMGSRVVRTECIKEYVNGKYKTVSGWKYRERYKHGRIVRAVTYRMVNGRYRRISVSKGAY